MTTAKQDVAPTSHSLITDESSTNNAQAKPTDTAPKADGSGNPVVTSTSTVFSDPTPNAAAIDKKPSSAPALASTGLALSLLLRLVSPAETAPVPLLLLRHRREVPMVATRLDLLLAAEKALLLQVLVR